MKPISSIFCEPLRSSSTGKAAEARDPTSLVGLQAGKCAYTLTGPVLKDMHGLVEDYGAALGRRITYVPQDLDA